MTLIVTPRGRGRWRRVTIQISKHGDLFAVHVGEIITIGMFIFRVCEVRP